MHDPNANPPLAVSSRPPRSTLPAQVALWLAIFIDSAGYSLIIPLLTPILLDPEHQVFLHGASYQFRGITLGLLLGAYAFMVLFMAPVLGNLSDRVGRKKVLVVCLGGLVLGNLMIGAAILSGWVLLALLGRVVAGATAGCQPVAQAAMVDLGRPETKAARLSMCLLGTSLGLAVGPVLAGFLSDTQLVSWFNYATPVFALAIAALGTLFLLVILGRCLTD